jgi:hypothetical protein
MISEIYNLGKDSLEAAILLNPVSMLSLWNKAEDGEKTDYFVDLSLDFFYIKNGNDFAEERCENILSSLLPPDGPAKVTSMTVDRETLLGMLTENENEAGLAAYSMLNDGIVLHGYENFYRLVLEAFARKLSG